MSGIVEAGKSPQTHSAAHAVPAYQMLARALRDLGVTTVFGLVSDDTLAFVTALENLGVDFCSTRHENNAVFAAEGYAAATRELGVAIIGRGPAFANAMHGIVTASRSGSPVLIISGDGEIPYPAENGLGPDYKNLNAVGIMAASGIQSFRPDTAAMARESLFAAVAAARTGRAVTLHLPLSVQKSTRYADEPALSPPASAPRQGGGLDEAAIASAAAVLATCRRPLILAGYGAHLAGAREALDALADKIGAVVATTFKGKDFFRGNPFDLGIVGSFSHSAGRRYIEQADCVVSFGASLNFLTTSQGTALPAAPIIQVDVSRQRIGRWHRADIGITGDARLVAERLAAGIGPRAASDKPFHSQQVRDDLAAFRPDADFKAENTARTLDPRSLALELDRLLPANRNIIYDAGNFLIVAPYLAVADPGHLKVTSDFASLGAGFGTAIGFASGRPDEPNVLVIGDGGFMMTLSELETAARRGLPLVVVVMNDCAYGAELHMARFHGMTSAASLFPDIDFAPLAEALGFEAVTIRTLDQLHALEATLKAPEGPILLDCKINAAIPAPFVSEFASREG